MSAAKTILGKPVFPRRGVVEVTTRLFATFLPQPHTFPNFLSTAEFFRPACTPSRFVSNSEFFLRPDTYLAFPPEGLISKNAPHFPAIRRERRFSRRHRYFFEFSIFECLEIFFDVVIFIDRCIEHNFVVYPIVFEV